jgi:hypothetical protein
MYHQLATSNLGYFCVCVDVFMYACKYVCKEVRKYVRVCVHTFVSTRYMYICMNACMYVFVCVCMYVCMHVRIYACICIYLNMYVYSIFTCLDAGMYFVQGVYKRMARFQKLTRNLFLTLHGQNVHRQQRQLSKFFMH